MVNLQELKKIIADAPEGATHFDGTYYRYEGYEHGQAYLVLKNGSWVRGTPSYPYLYVSALADIKQIVEQDKRIAEIEKIIFELVVNADFEPLLENDRAIREQAKQLKEQGDE